MPLAYYKRFRMEADLRRPWAPPRLPAGCRYAVWSPDRLDDHVGVLVESFAGEIDAEVFGCLADPYGCRQLVEEIVSKPGFTPEATWVIERAAAGDAPQAAGAIQGMRLTPRYGGVQNVAVAPWARGRGLGRALVTAACFGFQSLGLQRAVLEVTATNTPAIRLYESLGFRRTRTLYKSVELAAAGREG